MKVRFDPRRTLLFRLQHSAVVSVQTNRSAPAIALGASHQSSRGSARCSKPVLAGSVGRFRMPGKSHRSAWPFATAGAPEPGRTTGRAGVVWTVVTDEVQIAVRAQTEPPGSADRRYQGSCVGNPMTDIAFDARAATFFLNCPRCGLSVEVRSRWMAIRHCPRCLGRARTLVELFSSSLPAEALYAEGLRPRAAVGLNAPPGAAPRSRRDDADHPRRTARPANQIVGGPGARDAP